ncbi:hypothetical protein KA531_00360 [Candidatus Saccharibacteria bacterium]|nr:hypothetical protein [Candidatus Saccharibacteria bacterium]
MMPKKLLLVVISLVFGTSIAIANQDNVPTNQLIEISPQTDQLVFRGPDTKLAVSYTIPANLSIIASCKLNSEGWILLDDGGLIEPSQNTQQLPDCQDRLDPHQLTEEDGDFRLARVNREKGERDKKVEELQVITIDDQDYLIYQEQLLLIDKSGLTCTNKLKKSNPKSNDYHQLAKYQITGKVSCPKSEKTQDQLSKGSTPGQDSQSPTKSTSKQTSEETRAKYDKINDQITQAKIDEAIASGVYTGIDPRDKQATTDKTSSNSSTPNNDPNLTDIHPKIRMAVDWAKAQVGKAYQPDNGRPWNGWCDRFVALAYGRTFSGYHTAYDHFLEMNRRGMIHQNQDVPPGAFAFFGPTSNIPAGHVMISIGNGQFVSTGPAVMVVDIKMPGLGQYIGWSQPNPEWL